MTQKEQITSPACNCSDSTPSGDSITSNGGFIAMVAGLSIVVPLVCVLIMQLRRAKMAERARMRAGANARQAGLLSDRRMDPPPAYEQVFGPNFSSSSSEHSRHDSLDVLFQENEFAQPGNGNIDSETESRLTHVLRGHRPPSVTNVNDGSCGCDSSQIRLQGSRPAPPYSSCSVATVSGTHVSDAPGRCPISQPYMIDEGAHPNGSDSTVTNPSLTQSTNGLSTSHMLSSASQISSLMPSTLSALSSSTPPQTHSAEYAPVSSLSNHYYTNNRNTISENAYVQESHTQHLGMHVSAEDFFVSLRGFQDIENDAPPPSYEEALKILESTIVAKYLDINEGQLYK